MEVVVVAVEDESPLDVMIAEADKAMCRAKRAGKDNFCLVRDQPQSAIKTSEKSDDA